MKAEWLIAGALLVGAGTANAWTAFKVGAGLHEWILADKRVDAGTSRSEDMQASNDLLSYVVGVADAYAATGALRISDTSGRQLVAIVSKFVEDHPEQWSLAAPILIDRALLVMYRCTK